jgi:molybdate transport system permease protein
MGKLRNNTIMLTHAEWETLRLSLFVATIAVAGSLPFGMGLAWLLARKAFWGKTLVETAVNLPLVMPPVVTGYLLLVILGRRGWLGSRLEAWFGLEFVFDWKGAALASAVMAFPLMVRPIRLAFAGVDPRLETASRTLGAGRLATLWRITLPLARPGIIAGCVLSFARSLGEFGATIMIAGDMPGETRTIPLHIYSLLQSPGGIQQAHALIAVSIAMAAAAIFAGEVFERRSLRYRTQ